MIIRTAIYIRVSTDQQAREGDSLREQEETLMAYIRDHDDMIHAGTYIDEGISGQKLDREEFQQLMRDVQDRKIDQIIFTKLDRWFRSLRHYLNTQAILDRYNVTWKAVHQPYFDTSTAYGRAFVSQSMTWAELEAQNTSDRIKNVFSSKIRNGEVVSGKQPLGYKIEGKRLVVDPDTAPIVISIFQYYRATSSLTSTQKYMASIGLIRSQVAIKHMLRCTKYIGIHRDNPDYCPAIISRDLFDFVQRALSRNVRSGSTKHDYVFSGLVVCAECERVMSGYLNNCTVVLKSGKKKMYKYPSYRCRYGTKHVSCDNVKCVIETSLEHYLLDHVRVDLERYLTDCEQCAAPIRRAGNQKSNLEKKIEKLKTLYLNDLITLDEYKADRARYLEEIDKLSEEPAPKDLSGIRELLEMNFEEIYPNLSVKERRELWRSIIKEIRVDRNKQYEIIFL